MQPRHFLLDGYLDLPSQKGGPPKKIGPCLLCQTAGWIKVVLGTEVGLCLDGDPAPPQTVGRIKMKLGTQVGLGPGHIVLDGDAKGAIFGPYMLRPNGCVDQDTTWYGGTCTSYTCKANLVAN